jgi:hypothetical protein
MAWGVELKVNIPEDFPAAVPVSLMGMVLFGGAMDTLFSVNWLKTGGQAIRTTTATSLTTLASVFLTLLSLVSGCEK